MDYRFSSSDTRLFVRYDKIEPGDVLLTLGASPLSAGIAIGTHGSYSHAAIWLPVKSPGIPDLVPDRIVLLRAEADGYGVGPTDSNLSRATLKNGTGITVTPLQGVVTAKLLRHPLLKTVDVDRLLTAAEALQQSEFYLAYSLLSRLAVFAPPAFQGIAQRILSEQETRDEWLINGTFCSELVAKYYALLELPLFDTAREPHTISPNDLRRSRLVEVTGAILKRSDFDPSSAIVRQLTNRPKEPANDGRAFVSKLAQFNSTNIVFAQKVDDLTNSAHNSIKINRVRLLSSHKTFIDTVRSAIDQARDIEDHAALQKLCVHRDIAILVYCMSAELVRRIENQSPEQVTAEQRAAGDLTDSMFRRTSTDFNRTLSLMSLRYMRHELRKPNGTAERSNQLSDDRRRILTMWLGLRRTLPTLDGLINDLKQFEAEARGEAGEIHLREFIMAALNNATTEQDHPTGDPAPKP